MNLAVQLWEPSDAPPCPRDPLGEFHEPPRVWLARLPLDASTLTHLAADLSPAERARAAAYRRPEDGQRSVLGRALLRRLLAARLGLPPGALPLSTNPAGKPVLALPPGAPPAPRFNVSHSGSCVLVALHPVHEVGVDVERVRTDFDPAEISAQVFAPEVHAEWLARPEVLRTRAFFHAWTRHEAALKALGLGFSAPLSRDAAARLQTADLLLPDAEHVGTCAWLG